MKKILIALFVLLGWISTACAEHFYIEHYDIVLKVDSSKNIDIKENIAAYFTAKSHGIFREIPIVNNVYRADGKNYKTYADISNLSVSEDYKKSIENNNYVLKIGNPNEYVFGRHNYTIQYRYSLDSPESELYFNLIGANWNTEIKHVKFKIYMPKDFPYDKVGLSKGSYGTIGFQEGAQFSVNPNTNVIEGFTTKTLNPHEALTIRAELPNDYFNKKSSAKNFILVFLMAILTFISFICWFKYGKDEKTIPVVNFYPPKGMNSAIVGLIYCGCSNSMQVISLIIYLADKGFIKIEDKGGSTVLYKLKDYNGKSKECAMLMDTIFKNNEKITTDEMKESKNFSDKFFEIVDYLSEAAKIIYEEDSRSLSIKLPVILSFFFFFLIFTFINIDIQLNIQSILNNMCFFVLATIPLLNLCVSKHDYGAPFTVFVSTVPLIMMLFMIPDSYKNIGISIFCLLGVIISAVCLYQLPKKCKQATMLLGHILGFKKFLETAEAPRIKSLVEQNPQYCFNMLSYAYVLDICDEWIEKFEGIVNDTPNWYVGHFTPSSFGDMTSTLDDAFSLCSSGSGGSSGSSSGGGGFSGGGSGGGGGRSW